MSSDRAVLPAVEIYYMHNMHCAITRSQSQSSSIEPFPEQATSIQHNTTNTNNTSQKDSLAPLQTFARLCSVSAGEADATLMPLGTFIECKPLEAISSLDLPQSVHYAVPNCSSSGERIALRGSY